MATYQNDSTERLFRVISTLNTAEQCRAFFEDLCTIKELQDMAQRLDTAFLLDEGYSYQKIASEIGVSTATISRVSRALNYGENGYREVIDRAKKQGENA